MSMDEPEKLLMDFGILGCMMSIEAIKLLTGYGPPPAF